MSLRSHRVASALILAIVFAASAQAGPRKVIEKPDWIEKPTGDQLAKHYPKRAEADGVSGSAKITCTVTVEGRLTACKIRRETPKGYGFGEAALALSSLFLMSPKRINGEPVSGGEVTVPVLFSNPEYLLGDDAMVLTRVGVAGPQNNGSTVPCADGYGECHMHNFLWADQPSGQLTKKLLRNAPAEGSTFAFCTAGIDRLMYGCVFRGDTSDAAMTVINATLPHLVAPEKAEDGTPTATATIVVPFMWEWIKGDK